MQSNNYKTSMQYKIQILLAIITLFFSGATFAQETNMGNWFIYLGNQKINSKFNWHNEVQYRNYNFAGDLQQLLLRTGIGYNLSENNNNVLLGYAFIHSQNYTDSSSEKTSVNEHRLYQQFITRQQFSRFYLQHRYRVEERFLNEDTQLRFRYFLSMNMAFNKEGLVANSFYLSAYNEVFLNAQNTYFDRNRLYGGLGYVINKNFRVEVGVMNQLLQTSQRPQFQIMLFNNLPFHNN